MNLYLFNVYLDIKLKNFRTRRNCGDHETQTCHLTETEIEAQGPGETCPQLPKQLVAKLEPWSLLTPHPLLFPVFLFVDTKQSKSVRPMESDTERNNQNVKQ